MIDHPTDDLALAAEFPPATYAQWRKVVDGILKGASFEERLQSRSADGLVIDPLYPRAREASGIAGRTPGRPWQVLQRIDHPDPIAANKQALEDLAGGANGLVLVGADTVGAHGYGLMPAFETIERGLDGIQLDASIAIECELGPQSNLLPRAFAALVARRGISPETLDVRFGFDPLGETLFGGGHHFSWEQFGPYIGQLATEFASLGFRRSLLVADGRIVHGAGGTEAQELGFVIAAAVAYLRALEAAGFALDEARRMIFFRLTADTDQFLTIAKFQALRRLWQRVEESCRLTPEPAFVCAETAWRTMTRNDAALNILRATIATFAAGIGGADAVTVLPFTAAHGLPDAFARRIARNTQLILREEAYLARVGDPTAGTGWSQALTDQLSHAAWTLFQEIESIGGAATAIEQGLIQRQVATACADRKHAMARRQVTLVGANDFVGLDDAQVAVLEAVPVTLPPMPTVAAVERLVPMRLAEPFETMPDPHRGPKV